MTIWHPEPPQGDTTEQGLVIIGRPVIPKFGSPQGIDPAAQPLVPFSWIDDFDIQFVDDLGQVFVFEL